MSIDYYIAKINYLIRRRDMAYMINFFRNKGLKIGEGCFIYSNITTSESYLITIKSDVTISNDVQLITHDNSVCKIYPEFTDLFGQIEIGNNCFIGAKVIILPGVTISDNIIVGAGSVVTKSFLENNVVIGGNPAKKICSIDDYKKKIMDKGFNLAGLTANDKIALLRNNTNKFISK